MTLQIVSFGCRYGAPGEADIVLDLRCLQNPYWVPELRDFSGRDEAIENYVYRDADARAFFDAIVALVRLQVQLAQKKGKNTLRIACGCTGGHHRSVATAERLARLFRAEGVPVEVYHRDLERPLD